MRVSKLRISVEIARTQGWHLRGKTISKTFIFENFAQSMRFVNQVARLAESVNHHPDIAIRYNKVRLLLTTHDEGGLTMRDFDLARRINRLKLR